MFWYFVLCSVTSSFMTLAGMYIYSKWTPYNRMEITTSAGQRAYDFALANPSDYYFHYVPRADRPDKVQMYQRVHGKVKLLFQYNWIDGVDAAKDTLLWKIHNLYQDQV